MEITKEFHKHQWGILNSTEQFVAAIAGVQSGKTTVGAAWLVDQIESNPTEDHLIAAPTYKVLQQSTLKKFFQEFPYYRQFYKSGESVIDHPKGGKIYIRSTEDPYKLEGMTIKSAWLDEAGQMKPEVWTVVQARLAIKRGRLLITTTPYNMGWLYQDFYKVWQSGDPAFKVFNWSSEENPYFPHEEFERVRKTMDILDFEMRYMGVFRKRHGLVYSDFNDTMIVEKIDRPMMKVIAGIDWGFTNPSAITVIGIDSDRHYYLLDEYYQRSKTTSEIIQVAKNLQAKWRINAFYADPAEPDRIEEARRAGLYIIEANKDIKLGIDKFRQIIREQRFRVSRGCIYFLDEIENYHYPEEGESGYEKDKPVKESDHLMDAARYAIFTDDPQPIDLMQLHRIGENRRRKYSFT